jgi:hypothetical protein
VLWPLLGFPQSLRKTVFCDLHLFYVPLRHVRQCTSTVGMETVNTTHNRGRGGIRVNGAAGRPPTKNKHWVNARITGTGADADRWERGGHHGSRGRGTGGGGRGRGAPRNGTSPAASADEAEGHHNEGEGTDIEHEDMHDTLDELGPSEDGIPEESEEVEPALETIEEVKEYRKQVCPFCPGTSCFTIVETYNTSSSPKRAKRSVSEPSPRARWMILWFPSAWKTPSPW